MRSEKTKRAFVKYLNENKNLRFWQAVGNFSGYYILASALLPDVDGVDDTYFWEELDHDNPPEVNGSTKKEKL